MIDVNELRVGNRVVLSGKTAPRLILDRWKEGNEVMISIAGQNGVTSEVVSSKQINRVIVNDVAPDAVAAV
jgi:hypothetical protein